MRCTPLTCSAHSTPPYVWNRVTGVLHAHGTKEEAEHGYSLYTKGDPQQPLMSSAGSNHAAGDWALEQLCGGEPAVAGDQSGCDGASEATKGGREEGTGDADMPRSNVQGDDLTTHKLGVMLNSDVSERRAPPVWYSALRAVCA